MGKKQKGFVCGIWTVCVNAAAANLPPRLLSMVKTGRKDDLGLE